MTFLLGFFQITFDWMLILMFFYKKNTITIISAFLRWNNIIFDDFTSEKIWYKMLFCNHLNRFFVIIINWLHYANSILGIVCDHFLKRLLHGGSAIPWQPAESGEQAQPWFQSVKNQFNILDLLCRPYQILSW